MKTIHVNIAETTTVTLNKDADIIRLLAGVIPANTIVTLSGNNCNLNLPWGSVITPETDKERLVSRYDSFSFQADLVYEMSEGIFMGYTLECVDGLEQFSYGLEDMTPVTTMKDARDLLATFYKYIPFLEEDEEGIYEDGLTYVIEKLSALTRKLAAAQHEPVVALANAICPKCPSSVYTGGESFFMMAVVEMLRRLRTVGAMVGIDSIGGRIRNTDLVTFLDTYLANGKPKLAAVLFPTPRLGKEVVAQLDQYGLTFGGYVPVSGWTNHVHFHGTEGVM